MLERASNSISQLEDPSGTGGGLAPDTTSMSWGPTKRVIRAGWIGNPESVYSPIRPVPRPAPKVPTNRFPSEMAIADGLSRPGINEEFTNAPDVVYC